MLALGRTRLEAGGRALASDWLSHRPGLVLKYLAAERGRAVPLEELQEVFWPAAGRGGAANVRQAVHTLRDRLEPGRTRGLPSSFVLARHGGYELAPDRVWIDADDFEARARAGLQALERGAPERAEAALGRGGRRLSGRLPRRRAVRGLGAAGARAPARPRRARAARAGRRSGAPRATPRAPARTSSASPTSSRSTSARSAS